MQFTNPAFYTPMDREYHQGESAPVQLEKPILGVDELGVTVPEKHPVTGGNILQNVESNIRAGASKMQIAMSASHHNPLGGGVKAYGKDVRESLRELQRANNVMIEGIEMPTGTMTNLSGFDPQGGRYVSEEKRVRDLNEVKDAIKFVADVSGGGGVDIWSQEFSRDIHDAPWNKEGKFEAYEDEEKYATARVVDARTGRIMEVPKGQPIYEPVYEVFEEAGTAEGIDGKRYKVEKGDWKTADGKWVDPTKPEQLLLRKPVWDPVNTEFKVESLQWKDIVTRTENYNRRFGKEVGFIDPEEYAIRTQLDNQLIQRKGQSLYYSQNYEDQVKQLGALKDALKHWEQIEKTVPEEEQWRLMENDPMMRYSQFINLEKMKPTEIINKEIKDINHRLKHIHEASAAADAQAKEIIQQKENMVSLRKYALDKAVDSYSEAGIAAMDETRLNNRVDRPIHVGPEIGWPTAYGGHPEEFIELIEKSRDKMVDKLVRDRGFDKTDAKDYARKHISGCFDTGHMGMWLQNFKKAHPRETEDERLKRFNGWYMDMVKKMHQKGVIGSVQAVDSATGDHAHLPPGQGIFPVVESVKYLKEHGWDGWVVSEGHEEETFGQGRILLQAWKEFGAEVGDSYFAPGPGAQWSAVRESYFGHNTPPPYIVGQYAPSEDWVFWSGVPLE